ncbi:MAG TPA: hypothetical protein VK610_10205 [Rhodothermales bacterium]|nr:hypothetical protein [Rhodothermales bacterium]
MFATWGCPGALKVDNGRPLGDPGSDLPPVLALWLIGVGVDVVWNRPRRPTDNAKVERSQAVTAAWAEPGRCAELAALGSALAAAAAMQREGYPVRRLGGATRAEAYAGLLAGGRAYEAGSFSLARVEAFLREGEWVRRVGRTGQVEFYGQRWSVGRAHRRTSVRVSLEAGPSGGPSVWTVRAEGGRVLKSFGGGFLSPSSICGLSVIGPGPGRT